MSNKSMGDGVVTNSQDVVSSQPSSIEEFFSQQDKRQQSSSIDEIPEDVVWQILLLLPIKSLLRFNCICKSWCNRISDPQFTKLHLNRSIKTNQTRYIIHNPSPYSRRLELDYETLINGKEEIEIQAIADDGSLFGPTMPGEGFSKVWYWGSCNGLLCILVTSPITLILANPSIRQTKTIFCSDNSERSNKIRIGGGFGYDAVNDDYKVVKIDFRDDIFSIDVYSLKKNCWNYRGKFPFKYARIHGTASKYVNGAVHWLTQTCAPMIAAFDLTKEELVNIPPPPTSTTCCEWNADYELNTDGKYICLTYAPRRQDLWHIYGIWIMERYGVKESWKHIRLDFGKPSFSVYINLLNFPNSDVILLHLNGSFFLHNRKDKSHRWVTIKEIPKNYHISSYCFSYVESLISLGSDCKIVKGLKKLQQCGK